ncbi:MAG: Crp/Fnr family transcriptional regulator [Flavobacteriales bacterium]|nr:Crp/Fnr family transcriptional regulator [Flavobacteriales bacterium]
MIGKLKDYFSSFSVLGAKEIALLLATARIKQVNPGEIILLEGDMNYNFIIVLKGLLRNYKIAANGEERNLLFSSEGTVTGNPRMFADLPANENIAALEKSWIAEIDVRKFEALSKKSPVIQRFYTEALKRNLIDLVDRLQMHTVMTPPERYLFFLKHNPELVQRVPQVYLASYFGITPVSLSRIRSRLSTTRSSDS